MPNVEMSIDLEAIWERYHSNTTTPDDVMRLLLAYDSVTNAQAEPAALQSQLTIERAVSNRMRAALWAVLEASMDERVRQIAQEGLGEGEQ